MKSTRRLLANQAFALIVSAAGFVGIHSSASAQDVPHLNITQPGGMPGTPVMTGISCDTNAVTVTWDGPSGYYQLFQNLDLRSQTWQKLGGPSLARKATISAIHSNAFFRVTGPSPRYAGAQACLECHPGVHALVMNTKHAGAFTNAAFVAKGGQTNSACLPCHTVGYGLPTGFTSQTATPHLAGVQCENCHGPAANHAANENDPTVRPRVELAAQVCGGCHNVSQHPTFDEWRTSGHAGVVLDVNPSGRISSCGRCHSGSVRLSLLGGKPLPAGDANVGIVCVTCHNPHVKTANPAQLRNPVSSTNDFFLTTSDNFTNKYNPNINVCAQCHNHRGAAWTSTSRPPHHSPQYNMLLGTVGELASGLPPNQPGSHGRLIQKQCVGCHMPTTQTASQAHPAIAGHSFRVESFDSCRDCHPLPELLVDFTKLVISTRIQQVKAALDMWAITKAPASLRTNYGALAWEYSSPGELSSGSAGPTSAEQAQIPDNIKKARFNMYLVNNDGSGGVHNGPYAITLLETATDWVVQELNR